MSSWPPNPQDQPAGWGAPGAQPTSPPGAPAGPPPGWGGGPRPPMQTPIPAPGAQPYTAGSLPAGPFVMAGGAFGDTGMVRRRRPVMLAVGILLILAGAVVLTLSIVGLVRDASIDDSDIVARSNGGGEMTFTRGQNDIAVYTIWADSGSSNKNRTKDLVNATTCVVHLADGSTIGIDGNLQSSSTTVNSRGAVGTFTAPVGEVSVTCTTSGARARQVFVAKGGTPSIFTWVAAIVAGGFLLAIGIVLTVFGSIRRWVPVDDDR